MLFTIFTPAYNRGHLLDLCFQSLLRQDVELEWVIIDDGSTDDTAAQVARMKEVSPFPIRYVWQENAGKQAAWNAAIRVAAGRYFVGLDSDDRLVPQGLKILARHAARLEADPGIIGIRACAVRTSDGKNDAANFFADGAVLSWFDEFARPSAHGERIDILKTALLKEHLYPVAPGVRFIPEIWFYARTAGRAYRFIYTTEPLRLFLDDHTHMRLSRSSLLAHAKGHLISRTEVINSVPLATWARNPVSLAKTLVRLAQLRRAVNIGLFETAGIAGSAKAYVALLAPLQLLLRLSK